MSGEFDKHVIKMGFVKEEDVKELYKIRLCKDRTITFTRGKQKPFNKVAIAVLSVPTLEEAKALITFVGKLQWSEHELMPGKSWYKFFPGMEYKLLEYEDLPRMADLLKQALTHMREYKARKKAVKSQIDNLSV